MLPAIALSTYTALIAPLPPAPKKAPVADYLIGTSQAPGARRRSFGVSRLFEEGPPLQVSVWSGGGAVVGSVLGPGGAAIGAAVGALAGLTVAVFVNPHNGPTGAERERDKARELLR